MSDASLPAGGTSGNQGAPGQPAAPPAAAPSEWYASIADAGLKSYIQGKGWKDPGSLAESYRNLESLHGVPADQIVKLPKADDADGWKGVWKKLGAPEKADDYQLPVPEGGDPEFAKEAASWLHEQGIPVKQARALAEKWNAKAASLAEAKQAEQAQQVQRDKEALGGKWGSKYAENTAIAQRAVAEFGVEAEVIDKLEDALGYRGVMEFFHQLGTRLGEHTFVTPEGKPGFGNSTTPEMAQAQIQRLMQDGDFANRLAAGDTKAVEEWDRLHKVAWAQ